MTLQPVRRHGVDAAVLFADIMSPVLGMGIGVELVEGVGPVVERPIASRADVDRLSVTEPDERILEAVRLIRAELDEDKALVGFCGAPFTVAGYLVEGKPSRDFARTKALMYSDPETWHALMEKLSEQFARYVAAQVDAGADAIQVFDSWVGALSPADYEEFVAPHSARIFAAVDAPTIHFGTGATEELLRALARAGGDVIGLDWRLPLELGWERRARGAGQPRPGGSPRPVGAHRSGDARRARARARPARAHLQPRPRRAAADGPRRARPARRARAGADRERACLATPSS